MYQYNGEAGPLVNSVVYNGQTYSSSEFNNCTNIVRNMVIYYSGNYYRFIATTVDDAYNRLLERRNWEKLGNSYII